MKAVRCVTWGGPELLAFEEIPTPSPGPGEVLIRVRAASLNFPDLLIIQRKYQVRPELPFTPGAEVAGEIAALGPGVEGFAVGERVAAYVGTGGFAEYALAEAGRTFRLPPAISDEVGASFLLTYGTAWHALLDRAGLAAGERLLVLGAAGGVGLAACDIGRFLGAKVIAAASSPEKLALARRFGAVETIDYQAGELRAGIARATEGTGADVVFDPVGGSLAEPAFRSIAWRGRYLVIGFAQGTIPALPLNLPLLKGASVVGVYWGDHARREPARYRAETEALIAAIASGALSPLVSQRYPLAETRAALEALAGRSVLGKVIVCPSA